MVKTNIGCLGFNLDVADGGSAKGTMLHWLPGKRKIQG